MNEIIATLRIEGEFKKARLTSFTNKCLCFDVQGEIMYMNRNMFNTWQLHPELNFVMSHVDNDNGVKFTFLN